MGLYNPEIHHRRSMRLQGYDYSQCGAYFITICTKDLVGMFGEVVNGIMHMNEGGKIAQHVWNTLPKRFPDVELDAFVIMPNHIHGILVHHQYEKSASSSDTSSIKKYTRVSSQIVSNTKNILDTYRMDPRRRQHLSEMMRTFKAATSYTVRRNGMPDFAWKRDFYEHIIRNEKDLERIRLYIAHNPAKWQDDKLHPHMLKPNL